MMSWTMGASALLAAIALVGCDLGDTTDDGGGELPGAWRVSQATINGNTMPVGTLGSGTLTLNDNGSFVASGNTVGGSTRSRSGNYSTNGNEITFSMAGVDIPAEVNATLPVRGVYSFDSDSLEITLSQPISARGFTLTKVFFTR
jgi:hypothetical protein